MLRIILREKNLKIFNCMKSGGNSVSPCNSHFYHFELQKMGTMNGMEIDPGMQNLSPLGHQFKFSQPKQWPKIVTIWKLFVNCVEFKWWSQFIFFFINIIISSAFGSHPKEKVRLKEHDLVNFWLLVMLPSGEHSGWRILGCWCELYLFSG